MSTDAPGTPTPAIAAGVGMWVEVAGYEDFPQRSRAEVIEAGADEVLVAAPQYHGWVTLPAPGAVLSLKWTGERGTYTCPATLVSANSGAGATWRVRLTRPAELVQRREFVRAPFPGELAVVPIGDGLASVVKGEMTDLSEGGLRAQLRCELAADTAVEIHLELESTPVRLPGRVLRAAAGEVPGRYETVITFAVREVHAAQLRRVVLRRQMLSRQERRTS